MADLKINQLDPIIGPLQDNDLFVVKMKMRGTAVTDEDRKVSWDEMRQALNLSQFMPTIGGDFTGNVRLNNNIALQGKSLTNTSLQIAKINTSNAVELGNGTSNLIVNSPSIPKYFDGANSFDFITKKNLPTPGDINTYTKADIDYRDALKLSLTGGNVTGHVRLDNTKALLGLTATNSVINLIQPALANEISLGDATQKLVIYANQVPVWNNGSNTVNLITSSNLPVPGDIGAYTKGEVDTQLAGKLSLGGGILTGKVTLNNNIHLVTRTSSTATTPNVEADVFYAATNSLVVGDTVQKTVIRGSGDLSYDNGTVNTVFHTGRLPTMAELNLTDTVNKAGTALQPGSYGVGGMATTATDVNFTQAAFLRKSQAFKQDGVAGQNRFGGPGQGIYLYFGDSFNTVYGGSLFIRGDGVGLIEKMGADVSTGQITTSLINTLYGTLNPPAPGDLSLGGAYTKTESNNNFARKGVNSDITALNALTGTLKVGANATLPLEVTTLQQVQAMTSGTAGAVVGVVGGFIGAVMWFGGARNKIPAGYVAADGQELAQTDYPDLYSAALNDVYTTVSEANWQTYPAYRGCYVKSSSTGKFRVPDLNGVQNNSIRSLFLRGSGTGWASGSVGANAAPNIIGTAGLGSWSAMGLATGAFKESPTAMNVPSSGAPLSMTYITFDASRVNAAYGRADPTGAAATEVVPNSVTGVWIIRATNSYAAANTSFSVYNGNATAPAAGTFTNGGDVLSVYQQGGVSVLSATLRGVGIQGGLRWAEINATDYNTQQTASVKLFTDGVFALQPGAKIAYSDSAGVPHTLIGGAPNNASITIGSAEQTTVLVRTLADTAGALEVRSDASLSAPTATNPGWGTLRTGDHSVNRWWSAADGGTVNKTLIGGGLTSNMTISGAGTATSKLYHQRIVNQNDMAIINSNNGAGTAKEWVFYVTTGNATAMGSWQSGSDIRHKSNIRRVENALEAVLATGGYLYEKKDGGTEVGLIAQEVEKYCPEAVSEGRREFSDGSVIEDFKSLNISGFGVAYAFEAIKTLKGMVDDLTKRLDELESSK